MKKAIQLWTVRDELARDPVQCIQRLAKLGVEEVEGFDLLQLKTIFPILTDHSIQCKSSFLFWPHITGNTRIAHKINYPWLPAYWGIQHEIELALHMQLDTLVMGYWHPDERKNHQDWLRLCEQLNRCGESCHRAGLKLLYHHHAFEFAALETANGFDLLCAQTESDLVGFELDTLWWLLSGRQLSDVDSDLAKRVAQLHLKSGFLPKAPMVDERLYADNHFKALGQAVLSKTEISRWLQALSPSRVFYEQDASARRWRDIGESLELMGEIKYCP